MRKLDLFVATSALLLAAASGAHAGITTFTNFGDWQTATYGVVNRDFNELPGAFNGENGLNEQGVTFSASNSYLFSLGPISCGYGCVDGPNIGSGNYLLGPDWPGSIFASLQTPANAVGVDLGVIPYSSPSGYYPLEVKVTVNLSAGPSQTYSVGLGGPKSLNFFGVTDQSDTITGLTISPENLYPQYYCDPQVCYNGLSGPNIVIDNFRTGGAVPEPAAWALMVLGFGGAGAMVRRRRSAATA